MRRNHGKAQKKARSRLVLQLEAGLWHYEGQTKVRQGHRNSHDPAGLPGKAGPYVRDQMTRRRIYEIIEPSAGGDRVSAIYDCAMIAVILASLLPLAFKNTTALLNTLDRISVGIFILDYLLRLMTADYKLKKGPVSFLLYPISFMALLDLLCILAK